MMSQEQEFVSLYGLLGSGIGGSLSPLIHHTAAQILDIPVRYDLIDIPKLNAEKLESLVQSGYIGLNITSPYKKNVCDILGNARKSANTLHRVDDQWQVFDTDTDGFLFALKCLGVGSPKRCVFVGLGAVADSLIVKMKADTEIFVKSQHALPNDSYVLLQKDETWPEADLFVYSGKSKVDIYPKNGLWMDLSYPIDYAKQKKAYPNTHFVDGLIMLIEQARLAQQIWWSNAPSFSDLLMELKKRDPVFKTINPSMLGS
jgi:shikimate 5-dehydrogenase